MIEMLQPDTFIRVSTAGRTQPLLLGSISLGQDVEVFCKLSVACDEGTISLTKEAIAACLAADLGLPVPKPYIVEITDDFISSVPIVAQQERLRASAKLAFGSTRVRNQFQNWIDRTVIPSTMQQLAAEIFFFDAIIQNTDRRGDNPNCLVKGDELRIIDHELAFSHGLILGWIPPWKMGGFSSISEPGRHIFGSQLRRREFDIGAIKGKWQDLPDQRIAQYEDCIPQAWIEDVDIITQANQLIKGARDNIDACLEEFERVLS